MDGQSSQAPRGGGDSRSDERGWAPGSAPRGRDVTDVAQRRFADRTDRTNRSLSAARESTNLADILERVLDKGIVVAGDITLAVAGIDLLTLKIRLLVASVDKAQEMGINWWQYDPALSSRARVVEEQRDALVQRIEQLEARLDGASDGKNRLERGEAKPQLDQPRRKRGEKKAETERPQAERD